MKIFQYVALSIVLVGCSPASLEEYCFEGEYLAKELLNDCQKIQSQDDLIREKLRFKKKFAAIVDLMIAARNFQNKHPDAEITLDLDYQISNALRDELTRIYKIEGCKALLEEIERDSIHKLDLFIRKGNQ